MGMCGFHIFSLKCELLYNLKGSEEALLWEDAFLATLKRLKNELFNNETELFYEAARR